MSETFGDKMAGNYLKKIGWYLKSSIHGHPRKKKRKKKIWESKQIEKAICYSFMQSNIAIHGDMSETSGDKMSGNCLKKIGWYLKSSIHGHPRKKKGNFSLMKEFEGVNITALKCCSHINLKLGKTRL